MTPLSLAILIIAIALMFDFINGFHDAANSVATVVATRVLTPLQAVVWAGFFNFVSAFTFGTGIPAASSIAVLAGVLAGNLKQSALTHPEALASDRFATHGAPAPTLPAS